MRLFFLLLVLSCGTLAQSPDEEESVHFEGSANAPTDDEDIEESSGLPVDQQYASSPVMPKITTTSPSTTTEKQTTTIYSRPTTTLVRQHMITTHPSTTTTRISTRGPSESGETPSAVFAQNTILIAMGLFILLIFVAVIVIICCCRKQKGYTPAKQTLDT